MELGPTKTGRGQLSHSPPWMAETGCVVPVPSPVPCSQVSIHLHPPHPQEGEPPCSEKGPTGHVLIHLTGKPMVGRKEIGIAQITAPQRAGWARGQTQQPRKVS